MLRRAASTLHPSNPRLFRKATCPSTLERRVSDLATNATLLARRSNLVGILTREFFFSALQFANTQVTISQDQAIGQSCRLPTKDHRGSNDYRTSKEAQMHGSLLAPGDPTCTETTARGLFHQLLNRILGL